MRARIPSEQLTTSLIRVHPRRVAAPNTRQRRPGWHVPDIAVQKAGQ